MSTTHNQRRILKTRDERVSKEGYVTRDERVSVVEQVYSQIKIKPVTT